MAEIEDSLKEMLSSYPLVYKDKKKLKAILKDYFPEDKRIINQLFMVVEEGIVDDMCSCTDISKFRMLGYVHSLSTNYGISEVMAKEAVMAWCETLGKPVEDVTVKELSHDHLTGKDYVKDYSDQSMDDYNGFVKEMSFSGSNSKVFPNVIIEEGTYWVKETGGCSVRFHDSNNEYITVIAELAQQEFEAIFKTNKKMNWKDPGFLEVKSYDNWTLTMKKIN